MERKKRSSRSFQVKTAGIPSPALLGAGDGIRTRASGLGKPMWCQPSQSCSPRDRRRDANLRPVLGPPRRAGRSSPRMRLSRAPHGCRSTSPSFCLLPKSRQIRKNYATSRHRNEVRHLTFNGLPRFLRRNRKQWPLGRGHRADLDRRHIRRPFGGMFNKL